VPAQNSIKKARLSGRSLPGYAVRPTDHDQAGTGRRRHRARLGQRDVGVAGQLGGDRR
jgi:hypothetical protein